MAFGTRTRLRGTHKKKNDQSDRVPMLARVERSPWRASAFGKTPQTVRAERHPLAELRRPDPRESCGKSRNQLAVFSKHRGGQTLAHHRGSGGFEECAGLRLGRILRRLAIAGTSAEKSSSTDFSHGWMDEIITRSAAWISNSDSTYPYDFRLHHSPFPCGAAAHADVQTTSPPRSTASLRTD